MILQLQEIVSFAEAGLIFSCSFSRFIQFNYESIADHYAIADDETKALMEKLALVIIDFDKAIDEGFVQLNDKMRIIYEQERKNRA